jgi:hypothetical protein
MTATHNDQDDIEAGNNVIKIRGGVGKQGGFEGFGKITEERPEEEEEREMNEFE